jgi:hypothetical protein
VHGKGRSSEKRGGKTEACGRDFGSKGGSSRRRMCMRAVSSSCVQTKWRISSHSLQVFLRPLLSHGNRARARRASVHPFAPVSVRIWKGLAPRLRCVVRGQSLRAAGSMPATKPEAVRFDLLR